MKQLRFFEVEELEEFLILENMRRQRKIDDEFAANYQEPTPMISRTTPKTRCDASHEQWHIWWEEIPCQLETNFNRLLYKMANGSTEINEWIDTSQRNPDIPDAIHNFEQGQSVRRNEHLDYQGLNDRDFRQRCVVYNGSLYWLYVKAPINFKMPFYLDAAWIASKLEVQIDVAIQISQGFIKLGLGKKDCLDMLFNDTIYWEHIRIPVKTDGVRLAQTLSEMLDEMQEVTVEWQNCMNSTDVEREYLREHLANLKRPDSPFYEWESWEEDEDGNFWAENEGDYPSSEWTDTEFESTFPNDGLDNILNNPFGAHRLYHGATDGLSHEFLTMIRLASSEKIAEIRAGFKKGTWWDSVAVMWREKKPKYNHLTKLQKKQAWIYIHDRESQLKQLARHRLSHQSAMVIQMMRNMNKRQAAALIYAVAGGGMWNYFGTPFQFKKPKAEEVAVLWDEYNKM